MQDAKRNAWVEKLCTDLRSAGIDGKLYTFEVPPGGSFTDYMTREIRTCNFVLFIITPKSVQTVESGKGALAFEMQISNARRNAAKDGFQIIPIFREGKETPTLLSDNRYLDFRQDINYKTNLSELIMWLHGEDHAPPLEYPDLFMGNLDKGLIRNNQPPLPLSKDLELYRLLELLKIDSSDKLTINDTLITYHSVASTLKHLSEKYECSTHKIERFTSLWLSHLSNQILGGLTLERNPFFLNNPRPFLDLLNKLIDSIQAHHTGDIYDILMSLSYLADYGLLSTPESKISKFEKKQCSRQTKAIFSEIMKGSFIERDHIIDYLISHVRNIKSSHPYAFTTILESVLKTSLHLCSDQQYTYYQKTIEILIQKWLDDWMDNDFETEYDGLSKMMTIMQVRQDADERTYIDQRFA